MVEISMYLFGKPEWEFEEKIDSKKIREKGDELNARLQAIADTMDKLTTAGWDHYMTLYTLQFSKKLSKNEAEIELKKLGIDANTYHIEEFDEEDEDE